MRLRDLTCGVLALIATVIPVNAGASYPGENGDLVYFRSYESPEIYSTSLEGPETLLGTGTEPSWAADGHTIVFARTNIFSMNEDGSGATRLTSQCDFYFHDPVLSPDGHTLAFVATGDAYISVRVLDINSRAYLWNGEFGTSSPDWSPDGSRLVFTNAGGIATSDPDGSDQVQLTHAENLPAYSGYDATPSWSPDGTRIAFASRRDGQSDIYSIATDGTDEHRLTTSGSDDQSPAWSPDGSQIAWNRYESREYHLMVMDDDGGNQRMLGASGLAPSWQPISSQASFQSFDDLPAAECVSKHRSSVGLRLSRHLHAHGRVRGYCPVDLPRSVVIERKENGEWANLKTAKVRQRHYETDLRDRTGVYRAHLLPTVRRQIGSPSGEKCLGALSPARRADR